MSLGNAEKTQKAIEAPKGLEGGSVGVIQALHGQKTWEAVQAISSSFNNEKYLGFLIGAEPHDSGCKVKKFQGESNVM